MSKKDDIVQRKIDHVDLTLDDNSQSAVRPFSGYRLPYKALPEINLEDVNTSTKLFGKELDQPLIIASMTGGSKYSKIINTNLSKAAEACNVALGVGSQRIALEINDAKASFELVRKHAPNAVIFANMGAIQLNNQRSTKDYLEVVKMIQADALYLHINPLQEAIQGGGNTNYAGLFNKIAKLVESIDVPVFVKEVGHGIDARTAKKLYKAGVVGVDVAGLGGTSYAWIEGQRAKNDYMAKWFKYTGIPTDEAIVAAAKYKGKDQYLVASGGMRSPAMALKARALGADFYSVARSFLKKAVIGPDETIEHIQLAQRGLQVAMFSCGVSNWDEAKKIKLLRVASPNIYTDSVTYED
jgi:isopentenyl-diphosphate delta-isomerase